RALEIGRAELHHRRRFVERIATDARSRDHDLLELLGRGRLLGTDRVVGDDQRGDSREQRGGTGPDMRFHDGIPLHANRWKESVDCAWSGEGGRTAVSATHQSGTDLVRKIVTVTSAPGGMMALATTLLPHPRGTQYGACGPHIESLPRAARDPAWQVLLSRCPISYQ